MYKEPFLPQVDGYLLLTSAELASPSSNHDMVTYSSISLARCSRCLGQELEALSARSAWGKSRGYYPGRTRVWSTAATASEVVGSLP